MDADVCEHKIALTAFETQNICQNVVCAGCVWAILYDTQCVSSTYKKGVLQCIFTNSTKFIHMANIFDTFYSIQI